MSKGKIIVFSGLDGGGKSTQIARLREHLHAQGFKTHYLWTRGGYTSGFQFIKQILRRTGGKKAIPPRGHSPQRERAFSRPWVRKIWLVFAIADLMRVYGVQVRWLRRKGVDVICDRYVWDTQIDFRLNFPQEDVDKWRLWRALERVTPRPDAAFLLLIPVEESVKRSDVKGEPFRDPPEVLAQRLEQYRRLAGEGHWHVLDGRRSIEDLAAEIRQRVLP